MKRPIIVCLLCLLLAIPHPAIAYFTSSTTLQHTTLETADWTPPTSLLNYGSQIISETITNGTFTDGLAGWQTEGDVSLTANSVEIGKNEGTLLANNSLSQTFPNTSKNLTLEYQVFTTESLAGFDDPCFVVRLNDSIILQINSSDVEETTGWKKFSVELSDIPASQLTLTFSAGNNGDAEHQSWAEVRNITTSEIIGNSTQHFSIDAQDSSTGLQSFIKDCDGNITEIKSMMSFQDRDPCSISLWSSDSDGNVEQPNSFATEFFTAFPSNTRNLHTTLEPTGEYVITVPNLPPDLYTYEVRFVSEPNTSFSDMHVATFTQEGNAFFIGVNLSTDTPHFMIRAYDIYHNVHYFTEI